MQNRSKLLFEHSLFSRAGGWILGFVLIAGVILTSGCVPEYHHYYQPVADGGTTRGSNCGGPKDDLIKDVMGIRIEVFMTGELEKNPKPPIGAIGLVLHITVPQDHSFRFSSKEATVTLDYKQVLHIAQRNLTLEQNLLGTKTEFDFPAPNGSTIGAGDYGGQIILASLGEPPKHIVYELPETEIDGKIVPPLKFEFNLKSGTFLVAVNGC